VAAFLPELFFLDFGRDFAFDFFAFGRFFDFTALRLRAKVASRGCFNERELTP
jgi:hypothetical protein